MAWLLALTCGLRRGELAGLRWSDVDLERATLTIASQRTTDVSTRVVLKEPKGTSRRMLDLGVATVEALRAHWTAQARHRLMFGLGRPDGPDLLFVDAACRPLHPQRLSDLFQAAAREAGLPVIRLHDARHSCATLALSCQRRAKLTP